MDRKRDQHKLIDSESLGELLLIKQKYCTARDRTR